MENPFRKTVSCFLVFCFFSFSAVQNEALAQAPALPVAGTMVSLSSAYEPPMIKGVTIHKDNPFLFDFILDPGQDKLSGASLKNEAEGLIKYFLASLAIPDQDVWVNLSPYEKDKIVPETLGQTEMGRDLLAQDYILKQLTASLIYPEKDLGKKFWDRVYTKTRQIYGAQPIPVNTFNKVWIMADRAEVFEHNQTAFVVDQHLKVMLEEDYLALTQHAPLSPSNKDQSHTITSQIIREIILPEIEKEVNTGKNFANLRQIFNSIILANWYKKNLKQALLNQVYADQSKVKGIDLNDPAVNQRIYNQYLQAYKKGVFNYIKEDASLAQPIPRKYFSGGLQEGAAANPKVVDRMMGAVKLSAQIEKRDLVSIETGINIASRQSTIDAIARKYRFETLTNGALKRISRELNISVSPTLPNYGEVQNEIEKLMRTLKGMTLKTAPKEMFKELNQNGIHSDVVFYGRSIIVHNYLFAGGDYPRISNQIFQNFGETFGVPNINSILLNIEEGSVQSLQLQELKKAVGSASRKFYLIKVKNALLNAFMLMVGIIKMDKSMFIDVSLNEKYAGSFDKGDLFKIEVPDVDRRPVVLSSAATPLEYQFEIVDKKLIVTSIGKRWSLGPEDAPVEIITGIFISFDGINAILRKTNDSTFNRLTVDNYVDHSMATAAVPILQDKSMFTKESSSAVNGGIDLNTSSNMQWKVRKDGSGVEMTVDRALVEKIQREGINFLTPVILNITPLKTVWPLMGMSGPPTEERLALK